MRLLITLYMWLIGCIFGSFFNVVGYRVPNGLSIVRPGSFCPKCNHKLKWYELIPVFSYLIQKGKCRSCHERISVIYPAVELSTGVLFAASYFVFGFSYEFVVALLVSSFLVIVIVTDMNYLIIPDGVTLTFSICLIIIRLISGGFKGLLYYLLSGLGLFLLMYFVMILGNKIFKKESLGGGDVKLMFFVGLALGPILGLFTIFLSALLALPLSLFVYAKDKTNVIPFGPFILIAVFTLVIFNVDASNIIGLFV